MKWNKDGYLFIMTTVFESQRKKRSINNSQYWYQVQYCTGIENKGKGKSKGEKQGKERGKGKAH